MRNLIAISLSILLLSCSAHRQASELSARGNHDAAIDILINRIANGISEKNKSKYYYSLLDSYNKAVAEDDMRIKFLIKDNTNPKRYEELYHLLVKQEQRQQKIRPLLPLVVNGKTLDFRMIDYTNDIIRAKNDLVDFLYRNAVNNLSSRDKSVLRATFEDLKYVNELHPGYKNVASLMDEARFKGTDFVWISIENNTPIALPRRLEEELLQFNTFGLNDKWTVYHAQKQQNLDYDFNIKLNFINMMVSPERIQNNNYQKEKVIVDGWEYLTDKNGKQVKDSLGRPIKVDRKITVRCEIQELLQMKEAAIAAKVEFWDLRTKQLINVFPLESSFVFRDLSARIKGDKRALDEDYRPNIKNPLPFPSNEQMIYDCGQDLKNRLRNILASYRR